VNGIWGGYQGEGAKTVLPAKAGAKISMRLVPDQTPEEAERKFTAFVKKIAPKSVKVTVRSLHSAAYLYEELAKKAPAPAPPEAARRTPRRRR
jgi:acetylornithine deacetylase/succinyl-diaminopimelate desuccinylase-like protein